MNSPNVDLDNYYGSLIELALLDVSFNFQIEQIMTAKVLWSSVSLGPLSVGMKDFFNHRTYASTFGSVDDETFGCMSLSCRPIHSSI